MELLAGYGADYFQPDHLGEKALHILAGLPGDPDVRGDNGIVATQHALHHGKFEQLALLTHAGGALPEEIAEDAE